MLLGGVYSKHPDLAPGDTVVLRTGEERRVVSAQRDERLPCKWLVHLEGVPEAVAYSDTGAVWGTEMLSILDIIERR